MLVHKHPESFRCGLPLSVDVKISEACALGVLMLSPLGLVSKKAGRGVGKKAGSRDY